MTQSALQFRAATSADLSAIAALSQLVWLHTYAPEGINADVANYVLQEFTTVNTRQRFEDENQRYLLAESDGKLIGYLLLQLNAVCEADANCNAEIARLYVIPQFAGKGLGRALLSEARDVLQSRGHHALWLTVYAGNHAAIGFYQHCGFNHIGDTFFQLGEQQHANLILQWRF